MSSSLRQHIESGEVRFSESDGYHCNICDVPLGVQPLPHINGNQHKNKIFFCALQDPTKYPALYNNLPEIVREALANDVITGRDLNIECHVCSISLSGEKPLTDHLRSSSHRRKAEMKLSQGMKNLKINSDKEGASNTSIPALPVVQKPRVASYVSPLNESPEIKSSEEKVSPPEQRSQANELPAIFDFLTLGSVQSSVKGKSVPEPKGASQVLWQKPEQLEDDSVEEKAIQAEVNAGNIEDLGGVYKCTVCLMSLTGREPVWQHINGRKHRSKVQARIPAVQQTTECQKLLNKDEMEDDLFGSKKSRSKEPDRSLEERRHEEHLRAQRNAELFHQMHNPQYNPLQGPPTMGHPYSQPQHFPGFNAGPMTFSGPPGYSFPQVPQQDVSGPLSYGAPSLFQVRKTGGYSPRSDSTYQLLSRPRGYVGVFNNHFNDHPDWKRDGSELDDYNLKSVFEQMEYKVELFPNKTVSQVFQNLDQILRKTVGVDSLILFFLSHGKDEKSFYSADRQLINIRDIWIKLTDQNFPALADRPKILFLNYCRGEARQSSRFFDNFAEKEEDAPKDVAIVHASLPGFKALRQPTEGTVFIHSLCQVICKSACEKDIHEIIYDTSKLMQNRGGTTPSIEFIHFRKFYFM